MPTEYHPGEGYYDENDPSTIPGTPEYIARHEAERAARVAQAGGSDTELEERLGVLEGSLGESDGIATLDGDGALLEAQRPPTGGGSGCPVAVVRYAGEFSATAFAVELMSPTEDAALITDTDLFEVAPTGELQINQAGTYLVTMTLEDHFMPLVSYPLTDPFKCGLQLSSGDWVLSGDFRVFNDAVLPSSQFGSNRVLQGGNSGVVTTRPAQSFDSASLRPTLVRGSPTDDSPVSGINASLGVVRLGDAPEVVVGTIF